MERKRVAGRFCRATTGEEENGPENQPAAVGAPSPCNAPRPRYCRVYTRKRVAAALPELVDVLLARAKAGSILHARLLVTLAGLDKAELVPKVKQHRGKSFTRALLDELKEE